MDTDQQSFLIVILSNKSLALAFILNGFGILCGLATMAYSAGAFRRRSKKGKDREWS